MRAQRGCRVGLRIVYRRGAIAGTGESPGRSVRGRWQSNGIYFAMTHLRRLWRTESCVFATARVPKKHPGLLHSIGSRFIPYRLCRHVPVAASCLLRTAQGERPSALLHNLLRCHRQPSPGRHPPSPLTRPSLNTPSPAAFWYVPPALLLQPVGNFQGYATDLAAAVALEFHTSRAPPGCWPLPRPTPPHAFNTILRRLMLRS